MRIDNFVAIDFEKWNHLQTSVCEVGMVKYINGKKIDSFHSFIKPIGGLESNKWAVNKLKHITVQILENSPSFEDLFEKMKAFIGDFILICHNKGADLNYIYNCEKETGLKGLYHCGYIDTKAVTGMGLEESYKEYMGEDLVDHHQAMFDADNLASMFMTIQNSKDISSFLDLEPYVPLEEKKRNNAQSTSKKKESGGNGNVSTKDLIFYQGELTPSFFKGKNVLVSCGSGSNKEKCIKKIKQFGGKSVTTSNKNINVLVAGDLTGHNKHEIAINKQGDPNFYVIYADDVLKLELEPDLFADEGDGGLPSFKNNPFEKRKICIDGIIDGYSKEVLKSRICRMGGEIVTGDLTKNVHYIVVNDSISDNKKPSFDKLVFNGFNIRILRKEDIDTIFSGQYSGYEMPKNLEKSLHLTKEHYEKKHVIYLPPKTEDTGREYIPNPIYGKNMYLGSSIKGNKTIFSQMLGLVGVFSGSGLSDSTQIIVLSQEAFDALEKNIPHDELYRIEQSYNSGLAVWYDYLLTTESELLAWIKTRIELSGDNVLGTLYKTFLESRTNK